jgi:hypothetical protein
VRNTFIGYDAEVNRAGYDWFIEGSGNTFIGIVGSATTLGSLITGHRNTFINSLLENVNVAAGATDNKFDGCELTTAFNDSGTGTVRTRCTGVVSNTDRYVVSVPASGSAVFMGNLSGLVLIREMDTTGEIATFVLGPFGVGGLTFQSSTHWSFGTTPTQRWSVGNDGTNYRIYNAEAGIRRFGITRFTVPLA